jgi:hypothetical protein
MSKSSQTVEVPVTLRLSEHAKEEIVERAAASGTDFANYVSVIVEQVTRKPRSLEEISGDIYTRFVESGMTDDQLGEALEREKHEDRAQRRARRAS